MRLHRLKTHETAWDAIAMGQKPWEVRRNDRFFQPGDIIELVKTTEDGHFITADGLRRHASPHEMIVLKRRIGWMLQGGQFGIEPGFCVFTLEAVS